LFLISKLFPYSGAAAATEAVLGPTIGCIKRKLPGVGKLQNK